MWAARGVLWAMVAVLLALGVGVLFGVVTGRGRRSEAPALPTAEAAGFAVRYAKDYLSGGPAAVAVQRRLGEAAVGDPQGGAFGGPVGLVVAERVEVVSEQVAVVTVAAEMAGPGGSSWWHLAVPVWVDAEGRLAVAGGPALVPPAEAADPPPRPPEPADRDAERALRAPLIGFFNAYVGRDPDRLARLLAPGAAHPGTLGGIVTLEELRLRVWPGDARRRILATVRWVDPATGVGFTQRYDVAVVSGDGGWYVERIGAHRAGAGTAEAGR